MKFRIGIFSMVVSDFCGGMLTGERVYPAGAVADVAVEEFSDWFDGECPFVRHCPNSIDFHFLAPIIVIVVIIGSHPATKTTSPPKGLAVWIADPTGGVLAVWIGFQPSFLSK